MHIEKIRLMHFRSFENETLHLERLSLLVGPNGSGKSNVFRGIRFFFGKEPTKHEIYENLSTWHRDKPGAPLLSIYITVTLSGKGLTALADDLGIRRPQGLVYRELEIKMRAVRSGTVTYHASGQELSSERVDYLRQAFCPVWVPPIRDLDEQGLEPFRMLLSDTLRRSRGNNTVRHHQSKVQNLVSERAAQVLASAQSDIQRHVANAEIVPHANRIDLESVYQAVDLFVKENGVGEIGVQSLGTGHQSVLVMSLHRALAHANAGHVIFLLDEPASHLHPTAVDVVSEELRELSETAQVIAATHSPALTCRVGLKSCIRIDRNFANATECTRLSQTIQRTDADLAHHLFNFQMRLAEPLFARGVILVEGPFDAYVFRKTSELLGFGIPEERNIPVVPTGGKQRIVTLLTLLQECACTNVQLIFDRDAVEGGEPDLLTGGLSAEQRNTAIASLAELSGALCEGRRPRGVRKTLDALVKEMQGQHQKPAFFVGSPLEAAIKVIGRLTRRQRDELQTELSAGRILRPRVLLAESGITLLRQTCDQAIISANDAERIVANVLDKDFVNGTNVTPKAQAAKWLHKMANDQDDLARVLTALHDQNQLRLSEVGKAVRLIMDSFN